MRCEMTGWTPGDRVEHPTFGAGTVLECNDQHTTIHFDQHGRHKFASHLVTLTGSTAPAPFGAIPLPPLPARPRTVAERNTTDVGYVNNNRQTVIRATALEGS